MNRLVAIAVTTVILMPVAAVSAQVPKYVWTPTGSSTNAGGTNNTIPFWSTSATYQQILNARDFNAAVVPIKGMAMRVAGARTMNGRSWELRIVLSHTNIKAATASPTFSTNLGATSTVVYGSARTFTKFSWSTAIGKGPVNPPAFTIPFASPYTYTRSRGNLCWEWRHKNASSNRTMFADATSAANQRGSVQTKFGKGCTARGQLAPATVTISTARSSSGSFAFQSLLTNASSNASAFLALGATPKHQNIGWCTTVELVPAALVSGKTGTLRSWRFEAPLRLLAGVPRFRLYLQYVYDDSSQVAGLGLSDAATYWTPSVPGAHVIARIYKSKSGSNVNGDELATTGTVGSTPLGLVVGWLQ